MVQYYHQSQWEEGGEQWERLTPRQTVRPAAWQGEAAKVEKSFMTVQEQQKDQETAQALECSQDEARNFESSSWRMVKIKSSLEEI